LGKYKGFGLTFCLAQCDVNCSPYLYIIIARSPLQSPLSRTGQQYIKHWIP